MMPSQVRASNSRTFGTPDLSVSFRLPSKASIASTVLSGCKETYQGKRAAKLHKRIAEYKIPKKIRKNSKPLLKLLDSLQFKVLVGAPVTTDVAVLSGHDQQNGKKSDWAKKAKWRLPEPSLGIKPIDPKLQPPELTAA